jgi:hypothetical protein
MRAIASPSPARIDLPSGHSLRRLAVIAALGAALLGLSAGESSASMVTRTLDRGDTGAAAAGEADAVSPHASQIGPVRGTLEFRIE